MHEINVSSLIQAIKQTFERVTSERGWYQDIGLTKTGAGSIMNRFKKGNLSIEKMAELLEAKRVKIDLDQFL